MNISTEEAAAVSIAIIVYLSKPQEESKNNHQIMEALELLSIRVTELEKQIEIIGSALSKKKTKGS